jgi:hypothetical protein
MNRVHHFCPPFRLNFDGLRKIRNVRKSCQPTRSKKNAGLRTPRVFIELFEQSDMGFQDRWFQPLTHPS